MSKRVMESINDSTGKSRQTVHSYQPVWMAHWMPTNSNNSTTEKRGDSARGNKELDRVSRDDDLTNGLEDSKSVKESAMIESKTESLRMSSKSMGNEAMCSSLMKHGEDTDEIQAIKPIFNHNLERGKAIDCKGGIQFPSGVPTAKETSFRECNSIGEGTSKNPLQWVKTHVSAKERSSDTSTPLQERFVESSTHMVPYHDIEKYEFDKGKAVLCPLVSRPSIFSNNQFPNAKLRILEQEHCQKHSQSADLICERKMGSHSESDTSMNACFRECNKSLLLDASSMNDHHLRTFGQDWLQKMQNCSAISLLPNQCIASEKNEPKISHYDHYSLHKLPNCVHDMETMRICTTVDSVEAIPGGRPRFSQTTHSLLITKKTDVNISEENDIFRRLITKMNGNSASDLHNVPPFFGQANRGVKFQPLSSSSNSEGQGNVRDTGIGTSKVAIKNESSAETDTMDMDFLKDRPNSGANSTRSTKGFNFDTNLSPRFDVTSSREAGSQWTSTRPPDLNLELPALPAAASSSDNACPSSSKTQSLEMDMLLAHAEQPNPKSNLFLDDSSKIDPATRWVKRLKLSSSDSSARGTKGFNLAENLSHDKKREFFRNILKNSITSSEPTQKKHHGEETILSDRSRDLSKEDKHFTLDPAKKGKELLLSHAWIKRWLRNGSQISQKKPETVVVCEPQSSKLSAGDFQKKEFPSIAAMALMGRAMSGFQSCELQKKGTFTVWNSKAF